VPCVINNSDSQKLHDYSFFPLRLAFSISAINLGAIALNTSEISYQFHSIMKIPAGPKRCDRRSPWVLRNACGKSAGSVFFLP
jgi:hypothetical protein